MKKLNGPLAEAIDPKTDLKYYERINTCTGEIHEVLPEYATMSTKPGIGHSWISTYTSDVYPKDYTHIRGIRMQPPKYYDRYLESIDPYLYDDIKSQRNLSMYLSDENTPQRLSAREKFKVAQTKTLKRSL